MWHNKYVGIPYQDKGRTTAGLDCWGLVRLVYKDEFNIELPSFADDYSSSSNTDIIQELISQYKEGWSVIAEPEVGSVILFKVFGTLSHVGIYIGENKFIHAREGVSSVVIESIDSTTWSKRIAGYFKFTEKTSAILNSAPHPLRTEHYTDKIQPGTTIKELVDGINAKYNVPSEIKANYAVMVDGVPVPQNLWETTKVEDGQAIEYRAIAKGGNTTRTLLTIALIIVVAIYAPEIAMSMAGPGASPATVAAYTAAVSITLNVAGMALINAIAPIRLPGDPERNDPGTATRQNLFSGGNNIINKYGAIPVILGKARITPPLGAQQYVDFDGSEKSRLTSLLVWGYGPLDISDIQIGTNDIANYADYRMVTLYGYQHEPVGIIDSIYGKDVEQQVPNVRLNNIDPDNNPDQIPADARNPWIEIRLNQKCTNISVALHFPEGLRQLIVKGEGAGDARGAQFTGQISYRQLDDQGNPFTDWSDNTRYIQAGLGTFPPTGYTKLTGSWDNTVSSWVPLYQWTRVCILKDNSILFLKGAKTESKLSEPSQELVASEYSSSRYSGLNNTSSIPKRLPTIPSGAILLYDICTYGTYGIFDIVDQRSNYTTAHTGLEASFNNTPTGVSTLNISAGTFKVAGGTDTISLGGSGEPFYLKKDAFTYVHEINNLPFGNYEIRVKRTNYSTADVSESLRNYFSATLYYVTGSYNATPMVNPPGCTVARSAISILSSDNINGRLEGINGLVQSICLDWDRNTKAWGVYRPTSNPASLFLHVLTHPANAFRVNTSDNRINLTELAEWHEYCDDQGFTYNSVMDGQRSVLEILKDIAAAGRSSPTLIDGKWSVVTDKPRSVTVQHFTPHNSWGFESTKSLPRMPDAFRVVFRNEEKAYQEEQILVCNTGFTDTTAAVIEEIALPGVTSKAAAYKHARWHLAQLKLRPETYVLNTDFEYLVCNRGDVVKVSHDVPMWGTSTGRIKTRLSGLEIELESPVYLDINKAYTLRIRTGTGASVVRQTPVITESGYYERLTLTEFLSSADGAAGNLYMLGELGRESQDLVVLNIETMGNTSARLVLTDYSPEIYAVDYSTDYAFPSYNPNMTLLPEHLVDTISVTPVMVESNIISNESVLTRSAGNTLVTNIKVPFNNPKNIPKNVTHVQVQYDHANTVDTQWQYMVMGSALAGSLIIPNVTDDIIYKLRMRYVTEIGISGPWSKVVTHKAVGKTTPPSDVTGLSSKIEPQLGKVYLSWQSIPDLDVAGYEVRDIDGNWGDETYLFKGLANNCLVPVEEAGHETTYYIRAFDVLGKFSANPTVHSVVVTKPTAPIPSSNGFFNQTSLTNSNVLLKWAAGQAAADSLAVTAYEVELQYNNPVETLVTTLRSTLDWEIPAAWHGTAYFRVRAVDIAGNKSEYSSTISISKSAPDVPSLPSISVSGVNLELDWPDNTRTSLPIAGYEIRTVDNDWGFATGALWKGSASKALISLSGKSADTYTWYLRAFDSEGVYSGASRIVEYTINKPAAPVAGDIYFQDTSLTNATVTLNWGHVKPLFGLYGYEVSYGDNNIITKSNTITLPASWVGNMDVSVRTVDNLITADSVNKSEATVITVTVAKPNPIPTSSYRAQVIDNTVLLYWDYPTTTTLPISHIRIKKGGTSWADASLVGDKSGTFTSFSELSKGTYTYRIATVDTEGNESDSISLTTEVAQPPNFVFNAEYISTFTGTKVNAVLDTNANRLVLPIQTTETWQEHFTEHGWDTPKNQVDSGNTVFIQPGTLTGSYTEYFDYQSVLTSSQVTLSIGGTVIAGTPEITHVISTSLDGVTYEDFPDTNSIFATNFRFIKVTVTVQQATEGSIYRIDSLAVRLDSKQKADSGSVVTSSSDTTGTIVNFSQEFIDIISINIAANSSLPLIPVYDFLDSSLTGTYSVTDNVCTVNVVNHSLAVGQNVRIFFTSGGVKSGIYTVSEVVSANTYKFNIVSANTSGTVNTYPNSMRVYVYNTSGVRQNNIQVSWSVQGY